MNIDLILMNYTINHYENGDKNEKQITWIPHK